MNKLEIALALLDLENASERLRMMDAARTYPMRCTLDEVLIPDLQALLLVGVSDKWKDGVVDKWMLHAERAQREELNQ